MELREWYRRLGTATVVGWLILKQPPLAPTTPAPVPPAPAPASADHADVVQQAAPYLIGALPLLLPVLALGLFGDSAVLKTLLWRGNLAALSAALLPALLPLLAAGALFVFLYSRPGKRSYGAIAWPVLAVAMLLALFVPITLATLQVGILGSLLLVLRPNRRWPVFATVVVLLIAAVGLDLAISGRSWDYRATVTAIPRAVTGRVVSELPREVIVQDDGTVNSYYVVDVDDTAVTTITGAPASVHEIADGSIFARAACEYRPRLNDRSVFDLVGAAAPAGATPYCEDLLECVGRRDLETEIATHSALKTCLRELQTPVEQGPAPSRH